MDDSTEILAMQKYEQEPERTLDTRTDLAWLSLPGRDQVSGSPVEQEAGSPLVGPHIATNQARGRIPRTPLLSLRAGPTPLVAAAGILNSLAGRATLEVATAPR